MQVRLPPNEAQPLGLGQDNQASLADLRKRAAQNQAVPLVKAEALRHDVAHDEQLRRAKRGT